MVNKMNGESVDLTAQNIARLKELFPEILTDGEKIDFDMLKAVLGDEVDSENERYQFTWHGKKQMIAGTQKPSKGTLRPDKEKSKNLDTTENLYIEGDNLEVLKLLQKSYNGKIKMIYIDPPYNTGKDFVYKDNFKNGVQNYLEQTGQINSEGNRLTTNTESNGRFHTDWLNMMYTRLKLARNLLKDDGVIFISIDDHELMNLLRLCAEIFGESNFISNFVIEKRTNRENRKVVSSRHEYLVCYAKNIGSKVPILRQLPMSEKALANYKNPDNDPNGLWKSDPATAQAGHGTKSQFYELVAPNGNKHTLPSGRCWLYTQEEMEKHIKNNRIWFGKDGKGVPRVKTYLNAKERGLTPESMWFSEDVSTNEIAKNNFKKLFDDQAIFETPKPVELILQTLRLATNQTDNDIILDFFSGSATTAHAVMQLNAEDGGNRKYILVQIPEILDLETEAYKNGYDTICDIGEERIRRAGEKIKVDLVEKQKKSGMLDENIVNPESLDIGFRVLKLDTSNIREWNVDFVDLEGKLDLYDTPFVEGRSELDVVYEIMLKQGLELTYPIETFEVNGQTVYDIGFGSLFICLSQKITTDIAQAIIARRDEQGTDTSNVIFSDTGFATDSDKLNCIEILKDAGYSEDNILTV
ncbi:site-specific DNA-methyltransferase [Peribacillus sp. NPDC097197]|uniref:site-specific DNA-methyltransferase n=1 Tax=Peribacillus sp. NPDC097197 TaxID=3390615 RepID=UPI003D04F398